LRQFKILRPRDTRRRLRSFTICADPTLNLVEIALAQFADRCGIAPLWPHNELAWPPVKSIISAPALTRSFDSHFFSRIKSAPMRGRRECCLEIYERAYRRGRTAGLGGAPGIFGNNGDAGVGEASGVMGVGDGIEDGSTVTCPGLGFLGIGLVPG
jgi:hypothetical protein